MKAEVTSVVQDYYALLRSEECNFNNGQFT